MRIFGSHKSRLDTSIPLLGALTITTIVMVTYYPALSTGFLADDFSWLDWIGRLSLDQYLAHYFDPRAQTQWYRPLQGIQWWIAYQFFGVQLMGYHLLNIGLHLANCLLLYRITGRVTRRWYVALMAAALFACLSIADFDAQNIGRSPIELLKTHYTDAVIWPAVVDPLMALFYLLAVDLWLTYLNRGKKLHYAMTWVATIATLLCKETGVTLPVILFLADRLLVGNPIKTTELLQRYLPFLFPILLYLPVELVVQRQSEFTVFLGYGLREQIIVNLLQYLQALAFPWAATGVPSQIWLLIVASICFYFMLVRRNRVVTFFVAGAILPVLPVSPFGTPLPRYLYLPLMSFCVVLVLLAAQVQHSLQRRNWGMSIFSGCFMLLIVSNSISVATETAHYARLTSQALAPFNAIVAKHPGFPRDTLLYFVDPPIYSLELSGFFSSRYGTGVTVSGTDRGKRAQLHNHTSAYVFYFDEQGQTQEQSIASSSTTTVRPTLPIQFAAPIQFVGYEIANNPTRRGAPLIIVSYWRATQSIEKNYSIFAHLSDQTGQLIEGYDSEPQSGHAPTTSWKPSQTGVGATAALIPISMNVPPGKYRLELGMYYLPTLERLTILSADGQPHTDKILIEPIYVE